MSGPFAKLMGDISMKIIEGNVNLSHLYLTELPEFLDGIEVTGSFFCSGNRLVSLKNSPAIVRGDFYCYANYLVTLEGAPEFVGGCFSCHTNQLRTLKGSPRKVGQSFICISNQLISLEGAPDFVGGPFNCKYNTKKFTQDDVLAVCQTRKAGITV